MVVLVWISLLASLVLLALFPLLFGELMAVSLTKLHLSPASALLTVIAIIVGGFINIPVKRIAHPDERTVHPLATFGLFEYWPELRRVQRETIVAINLGGCLIPAGLAAYELIYLAAVDAQALWAVGGACAVTITVCYLLARPVPGLGIALPGLVPALVAAALALLLAPGEASPVAFVAGIAGPLVGADLLHLKDIEKMASGVMSIGGAGTFDGIVLSGIVAAYLA